MTQESNSKKLGSKLAKAISTNHLPTKVKVALLPLLTDPGFIGSVEANEEPAKTAKCSTPAIGRAIRNGGFALLCDQISQHPTLSKDERESLVNQVSDHYRNCLKCQTADQANEVFAKRVKKYARENRSWLKELLQKEG